MAAYRDAIVTFFDILGYSELVLSGKDPDEVLKVLAETRYHSEVDDELQAMFESSFINFSDCIVRITPLDGPANKKGSRVGLLFHELLGLVHIQLELAALGIAIRGGVTAGQIYCDGKHVFGPALVQAYGLESQMAVHPRVVVDPALLHRFESDRALGASHHNLKMDRRYVYSLLREDADGIWFVDYIRAAATEVDDPPCGWIEFLRRHRIFIENGAAKAGNKLGRVSVKYAWLARYHNEIVSGIDKALLTHCGVKRGELMVDTKFPWMGPRTGRKVKDPP